MNELFHVWCEKIKGNKYRVKDQVRIRFPITNTFVNRNEDMILVISSKKRKLGTIINPNRTISV